MDAGVMTRKTRYKLSMVVLVFLMLTTLMAVIKGMDALAGIAVTGVMTTLSTYIWGETKRPSDQP
jgi:hypothetical protein